MVRRRLAAIVALPLVAACSTTGGGTPALPTTPGSASSSSPSSASPSSASPSSASPSSASPSSSPSSPSPTADPNAAYGLDVPPRLTLTALGSTLALGDEATVAWQPAAGRVGALRLQVTAVRQGVIADFGAFELDKAARTSTPYYVDVIATNVGRTDLGGAQVPLLLQDQAGALVQPTSFDSTFTPCSARPLPSPYPRGATGPVCLVFLAPDRGTATGVVFRPQESYAPITWGGSAG